MQLQHAKKLTAITEEVHKTTELKMEFHHDLASQLKQEIDVLNEKLEAQKKQLQSCTKQISRSEEKLEDSKRRSRKSPERHSATLGIGFVVVALASV